MAQQSGEARIGTLIQALSYNGRLVAAQEDSAKDYGAEISTPLSPGESKQRVRAVPDKDRRTANASPCSGAG